MTICELLADYPEYFNRELAIEIDGKLYEPSCWPDDRRGKKLLIIVPQLNIPTKDKQNG